MNTDMTISQLIDQLRDIYSEHGDVPVLTGRMADFKSRQIEVVEIDDWDNTTKTDDGEVPGIGHAVLLGPRF